MNHYAYKNKSHTGQSANAETYLFSSSKTAYTHTHTRRNWENTGHRMSRDRTNRWRKKYVQKKHTAERKTKEKKNLNPSKCLVPEMRFERNETKENEKNHSHELQETHKR